MNGTTLVTGASGFIGRHLVDQLLHAGERVRVVVRDPRRLDHRIRSQVEIVVGDVCDRATMETATIGAKTVLHLAACARAWSMDCDEFRMVNVAAVEHLLEVAERAAIERLVHVSTILALPPHRPAAVRGEARLPTPYERSKQVGDQLVAAYAAAGHNAVIVHPTRVYGPGPLNDANGVTRVVALYLSGRFRFRIADNDVLANYVHVDDAAAGIRLAAERGRPGARYMLGGPENVSFSEFLKTVGDLIGKHRRTIALPSAAALAVARAAPLWGRVGGNVSITPGWVRVFLEDRRADIAASRRELGYDPRPLRQGLAETISWLQSNGR